MEIWKDVIGYEGFYQVSDLGRVRSLTRLIRDGRNKISGKMLSPFYDEKGYLNVHLSKEGSIFHTRVHRLVAKAFIPNTEILPEVNHKDFNKNNNTPDNLEWVTGLANSRHFFNSEKAESRNKKLRNENNPNAKLTQKDVDLIKKLRNEHKIKRETLALLFGVSLSQIKRIIYGWQWNKEAI